jgi:MATE family multidrug resistance protein
VAATAIDAGLLAWAQRRDGMPFGLDERALAEVRPLWRLGVPLGLQMLLEVGAFALLTGIFASMSEIDVAAHQIALQVAHFSFLPAFALGEAASVLAGQAVGAKSYRLVKVVARKTLWVAAIYTGFCGLVFAALPRVIAGAFTDDALLIDTTVKLLYVAAIFQIFDGANIVARSILRGTGDVRFPALVSVAVVWITTPPLAIALGYGLGMGVLGGWIGLCVEIIVGALILWRRLETNGWLGAARRSQRELDGVDSGLQPAPAA